MKKLAISAFALLSMMMTCSNAALAGFDWKEGYTRISRGTAHRIALTQAHGYIKNSDLDMRDGRPRWKVQVRGAFGEDSDVFIDAMTGAIIGVKYKG